MESILLIENLVIDTEALRDACTYGCPDLLRPLCWRLFLHYLPKERIDWPHVLSKRRDEYQELVENLITGELDEVDDHPLSDESKSEWSTYFKDNEVLSQIDKDVRRLRPEIDFFQRDTNYPCRCSGLTKRIHAAESAQAMQGTAKPITSSSSKVHSVVLEDVDKNKNETHWQVVERILFIYSKVNAGVKYVQGMNEILGPIYYVLASDADPEWSKYAEADTFYCFQNLMSEIKDNFIKLLDNSNCGIESTLSRFHKRFEAVDHQLYAHVVEHLNIKSQYYAFRWLSLLLSQEFSLPDVIALWDVVLASANRMEMVEYLCLAMLVHIRETLMEGDFSQNVRLLQNYPDVDVNVLITKAWELKDAVTTDASNNGAMASQFWNSERLTAMVNGAKDRLSTYAQSARRHLHKSDGSIKFRP